MFKKLALLFVLLFLAGPAFGLTERAPFIKHAGGGTIKLCQGSTITGTCQTPSLADAYYDVSRYRSFTVTFFESGTGGSCDLYYATRLRADSGPANLDASTGVRITTASLTMAAPGQRITGTFYWIYGICTAGSASHTLTVQAQE